MLNLSVDEVLTTTRTVRKRLDLTRPVPRAAGRGMRQSSRLQAPNGSNNQSFEFVFVEDAGDARQGGGYLPRRHAAFHRHDRRRPLDLFDQGDVGRSHGAGRR